MSILDFIQAGGDEEEPISALGASMAPREGGFDSDDDALAETQKPKKYNQSHTATLRERIKRNVIGAKPTKSSIPKSKAKLNVTDFLKQHTITQSERAKIDQKYFKIQKEWRKYKEDLKNYKTRFGTGGKKAKLLPKLEAKLRESIEAELALEGIKIMPGYDGDIDMRAVEKAYYETDGKGAVSQFYDRKKFQASEKEREEKTLKEMEDKKEDFLGILSELSEKVGSRALDQYIIRIHDQMTNLGTKLVPLQDENTLRTIIQYLCMTTLDGDFYGQNQIFSYDRGEVFNRYQQDFDKPKIDSALDFGGAITLMVNIIRDMTFSTGASFRTGSINEFSHRFDGGFYDEEGSLNLEYTEPIEIMGTPYVVWAPPPDEDIALWLQLHPHLRSKIFGAREKYYFDVYVEEEWHEGDVNFTQSQMKEYKESLKQERDYFNRYFNEEEGLAERGSVAIPFVAEARKKGLTLDVESVKIGTNPNGTPLTKLKFRLRRTEKIYGLGNFDTRSEGDISSEDEDEYESGEEGGGSASIPPHLRKYYDYKAKQAKEHFDAERNQELEEGSYGFGIEGQEDISPRNPNSRAAVQQKLNEDSEDEGDDVPINRLRTRVQIGMSMSKRRAPTTPDRVRPTTPDRVLDVNEDLASLIDMMIL